MNPCTYTYYDVDQNNTDDCCRCNEPLNQGSVVAHSGTGNLHPIHLKCIEVWAETNLKCPSCNVPIDPNLPISWERKVKQVSRIGLQVVDELLSNEAAKDVIFILYLMYIFR